MARIYLDFERYKESIIEVGAILTYNQELISSFHSLVFLEVDNDADYHLIAQHSHCIQSTELKRSGRKPFLVKSQFYDWIRKFDFSEITILGHGDDVTEEALHEWNPRFKQFNHLTYEQVNLPPWIQRETAPYHMAALKMKEVSTQLKCSKVNHQVAFQVNAINSSNHSRISRIIYKHHCALVDAFELAFYEQQLPLFCCDNDFKSVICKHSNRFMMCTIAPLR